MVSKRRPGSRKVVLQVEPLEERCVLAADAYVRGLYADLLHRAAGPEEVNAWTSVLAAGASPAQVAQAFTQSTEYRSNEVRFDYLVLLNRQPSPLELAAWVSNLQAGLSDEQLEAGVLASQEYFQRNNQNSVNWVSAVYQAVTGQASPATVVQQVAGMNLQSFIVRFNLAFSAVHSPLAHAVVVTDDYQQLLLRDPDVPGGDNFVRQLDLGLQPSQVVVGIVSSPEFQFLADTGQFNTVTGIPPGSPVVSSPLGFNPALGTSLGGNSLFQALPFFINPLLVV